jgi:Zn-dependent peptidase ImmA (M78 family)
MRDIKYREDYNLVHKFLAGDRTAGEILYASVYPMLTGYVINNTKGILGACKSVGLKRIIIIKPDIKSIGQERFTIAHELGHILVHHNTQYCKRESFNMWRNANDKETEANVFAAELLLPQRKMLEILSNKDITMDMIKSVADLYQTSMSPTAIRLIKLYNDSAVIISHRDGKIAWKVNSPECYFNVSGSGIVVNPVINKVNKNNVFAKENVDPLLWIDNDVDNLICNQETLYFNKLNSYLTVLKFIRNDG